ncbi:MAG: two-CW domain-containing protein [Candidatus Zixiibacteriota bacterium]
MERKLNCWEFKNCGRERGGLMAATLGECPVSTSMAFDGTNGGIAAGRSCWMVRESNRLARVQVCTGASCHTCEFYRRVIHEERSAAKHQFSTTVA